jgi:pimeloyl-ACP methyl ester carboxylesterase
MMAGPATSGSEVLLDQNRRIAAAQGADAATIAAQVGFVMSLNSLIRAGDTEAVRRYASDHNAALPPERQQSAAALDPLAGTYFDSLVRYDPKPALTALRVPVLAFYGDKDLQVSAAQNAPLAQQLPAKSPSADVHVFPGLNHLMQPADTGLPAEYATIETTIAPEVLDYVTTWLRAHAPPP